MLENLDLFFIRHGKLDLPYKRHEDMPYEILMGLSTGKLDPGIIDGSTNLFIKNSSTIPLGKINLIYYNNSNECSRRSEETAKLIAKVIKNNYQKDAEVVGNPDLREIRFDVSDLLTEAEYQQHGMDLLRKRFYEELLNGSKIESFKENYKRAGKIFKDLAKYKQRKFKVILVTHGFFMKVLEIYIKRKGQEDNRDIEREIFNLDPYGYLRGFGITYDLSLFVRV